MPIRTSHHMQVLQAIIISGLVPLLGLIFWGWDWRQIIVFYWLGNISGGVMAIIDIIRSDNPNLPKVDATGLGRTIQMASKASSVLFFAMHYGIFTLVHGIFVFALVSGGISGGVVDNSTLGLGGIVLAWLVPSVLAVIARILRPAPSLTFDQVTSGMYKRLIALHGSIVLGALAIKELQLPSAAAFVLVCMSVAVELFMNRSEVLKASKNPSNLSLIELLSQEHQVLEKLNQMDIPKTGGIHIRRIPLDSEADLDNKE